MPRAKKVNAEKKIAQKRKSKNTETQIAETEVSRTSNYSTSIVLENGKTDIIIDWDKLREYLKTI